MGRNLELFKFGRGKSQFGWGSRDGMGTVMGIVCRSARIICEVRRVGGSVKVKDVNGDVRR